MKSEETKGAGLGVLARCVWRINWLGMAFDKKKDMNWIVLSWGAVLIAGFLGMVLLARRSEPWPGGVMGFVASYGWASPGEKGWAGLSSAPFGVLALVGAGAMLRLARLIQALWRPLPKGAGDFAGQHPVTAWCLSPVLLGWAMNERWALRAMSWARAEGEKGRAAPAQAVVGLLAGGAVLALVFESLLMLGGLIISALMGAFLAGSALRGGGLFAAMALIEPGMVAATGLTVAIWARQAIGLGALGWMKKSVAQKLSGLRAGLARPGSSEQGAAQSKSGWSETKERWAGAVLRQAEKDGALSEAERALLRRQTPQAKAEARGERNWL